MATQKSAPIALVTGGSRGLGRNMALHLADRGVDSIITYRSAAPEAEEVTRAITAKGRRAMVEVFFAQTKRMVRLPLVDVGPGPAIQAVIDLTVAATAFLQNKNEGDSLKNVQVICRIIA